MEHAFFFACACEDLLRYTYKERELVKKTQKTVRDSRTNKAYLRGTETFSPFDSNKKFVVSVLFDFPFLGQVDQYIFTLLKRRRQGISVI